MLPSSFSSAELKSTILIPAGKKDKLSIGAKQLTKKKTERQTKGNRTIRQTDKYIYNYTFGYFGWEHYVARIDVLYVQEVLTQFISNLPYKMGHDFSGQTVIKHDE